MSSLRIGRSHKARKALFTRGIRRGFLTVGEIDEALPPGSLTDAERWLLYYSLHAARVEVLDRRGKRVDLEDLRSSRDELRGEGEGETTQQ
ncbi:MAG TPA: RNA polymerase sigma factor region1.1 domain-containing protein [Myxococcales bacterium]|nr:RNA polymerase sigma factor region1.1 domain-containing protein [Myxococcales bacterium]